MKHQITIKITTVKEKVHHEDLSALGEYLVTFDSDTSHDLGSKSMSILMSTVPISYPEDLAFTIIDFDGSNLEDLGNEYTSIIGTVQMV
ncbi:hypothetical protein AKG60_09340 [Vibrio parahaemolyticus]|uniref:Uncharacterized protein n=1 Tax=Vibrio parahaemolyticus TaxID=670 RepID=A0AAX0MCI4_VIBPH|nr:hypothetical protein [Vibrio parahaemolyticus]EGR3229786.1 hypothetical protein [Vibrio parahaemolyticus]EJG0023309.1 hypothetical protein [Vibrio parahaemolyticus]EJG0181653.1 hypothetical protein [Vibrio parahaemolyticus]OQK00743.1 hypothetical protein AKG60_09340 [Vibrio parahaemolyticus]